MLTASTEASKTSSLGSNPSAFAKIMKKIVYIDMDGVVADWEKAACLPKGEWIPEEKLNTGQGFYQNLELIEGASDALKTLSEHYDLYFLSTPEWANPYCWMEKRLWVEQHFGELMFKRLILTHQKKLLRGDFLIDDNVHEGFKGVHIHFGQYPYQDWEAVIKYMMPNCDYCHKMVPRGDLDYHYSDVCSLSAPR